LFLNDRLKTKCADLKKQKLKFIKYFNARCCPSNSSVTQTTSSISSKITKIAQFGVYPANFAASTLFYYGDSVASTEQLMVEAALAFVSIALMEASEAGKLSSAPVNPAVSHKVRSFISD